MNIKQIINGKMYNTKTAEFLGKFWKGESYSDFNFVHEGLFRKKNGEFFVAGEGGARTEYASSVGNSRCEGSKIFPFTLDEAKEWAEKHLSAEKYEAIFGTPEE